MGHYVREYNTRRLHSSIGYITPADMLAGKAIEIFSRREEQLAAARRQRQIKRAETRAA